MKTVDEVFELIEIREEAGDALLRWQHGPAWKLAEANKVHADAEKELRTAIEEIVADAARYRWLRDSEVSQDDQSWIAVGEFNLFGVSAIARNDLDAAIDAAMEAI